jgi:hypothetical protein
MGNRTILVHMISAAREAGQRSRSRLAAFVCRDSRSGEVYAHAEVIHRARVALGGRVHPECLCTGCQRPTAQYEQGDAGSGMSHRKLSCGVRAEEQKRVTGQSVFS